MPKLVDIHNRYKEAGLETVGVDLDSFGTKRVVKFVKGLEFEVTYPIVVDKRREVAAKYGVSVLPTTIIIDNGSASLGWPGGIARRFTGEGWDTSTVDGHDHHAIEMALRRSGGDPQAVIARVTPEEIG